MVQNTDFALSLSRALLGAGPLMTDLHPFVPLRKRVVSPLRPADLGAHGGNSRRVDGADCRRNNRANARWTNRANFYSAVAKRDYMVVDTPTLNASKRRIKWKKR